MIEGNATVPSSDEPMLPELLSALQSVISAGDVLQTIAEGRPNWIIDISERGVVVETVRSKEQGH